MSFTIIQTLSTAEIGNSCVPMRLYVHWADIEVFQTSGSRKSVSCSGVQRLHLHSCSANSKRIEAILEVGVTSQRI